MYFNCTYMQFADNTDSLAFLDFQVSHSVRLSYIISPPPFAESKFISEKALDTCDQFWLDEVKEFRCRWFLSFSYDSLLVMINHQLFVGYSAYCTTRFKSIWFKGSSCCEIILQINLKLNPQRTSRWLSILMAVAVVMFISGLALTAKYDRDGDPK